MSRPESQRLFSSDSAREEATYETASTISAAALPDTSRYAAAAQPRQEKSPAYEMVAMKDGEASTKPSQQPPSVWNQWRVEILNCILMISMLCAMVVVLSLNNGKALPDWSSTISINTVVAVISAVLKASAALILAEGVSDAKWKWFQRSRSLHDFVVFDNASRGAWGCLQLLAAPRGGHYTASLGAGLILLTLALDPFTQQLVHHYDCRQAGETPWSKATLPRATR